jgi:hypothetical protein
MTDASGKAWQCPKDGTAMQSQGRPLGGVALPGLYGHLHGHGGHASRATLVVVADPDERRHESAGEGRGPAPSAALDQAGAFVAQS